MNLIDIIKNKGREQIIEITKAPPSDFVSEKILLGALLYSASMGNRELEKVIGRIENVISAQDFQKHLYVKVHIRIYELIFLNYEMKKIKF